MIGENIRKLRRKRKWTQAQLAEKARVYKVDISRIETGARLPSRIAVERIANALEVDISDIYGDISKMDLADILVMDLMDQWLEGAAR